MEIGDVGVFLFGFLFGMLNFKMKTSLYTFQQKSESLSRHINKKQNNQSTHIHIHVKRNTGNQIVYTLFVLSFSASFFNSYI